jgi:diguanylate cyclase (GGDEF)-like protein
VTPRTEDHPKNADFNLVRTDIDQVDNSVCGEFVAMISLKRYLDAESSSKQSGPGQKEGCLKLLSAYRSGLFEMAECGANTCPSHGAELKRAIVRIDAMIGEHPDAVEVAEAKKAVSDLLQGWGKKAAQHYSQKAREVKDLLLVMARTAESLGHKDERYAHQFDLVTSKLDTVASLDDITVIRTSVEESARDLRRSLVRLSAESKAVIDHLRAEVLTYQAKLEKAEYAASCDALTGLGSRMWIEGRIQERIEAGSMFTLLMINIEGFQRVNQVYGNLTGDLFLKEFAGELRSSCRFSDLVARWGSDQFIVVLDCARSDARAQATRLLAWICKSYHVPGKTGYVNVHLDASLGLAEYCEGDTLQYILERASVELCAQRKTVQASMSA